jgi:uncharacterized paraquat-inducible protein A
MSKYIDPSFHDSSGKMKVLNDARKYCPGCKTVRSMGQYAQRDDQYCIRCVRRGTTTPQPSLRKPQEAA